MAEEEGGEYLNKYYIFMLSRKYYGKTCKCSFGEITPLSTMSLKSTLMQSFQNWS